jgi:hypothetical protein
MYIFFEILRGGTILFLCSSSIYALYYSYLLCLKLLSPGRSKISIYILAKIIKGYGFLEKKCDKYSEQIKKNIANPALEMYYKNQLSIIFINDGVEDTKYFKKGFDGMRKPIRPYDMIINIFYIEKNNNIVPYIQTLDFYNKEKIENNYKISNIKFLDITLFNFEKPIKFNNKYNWYVVNNILFKPTFIKWSNNIDKLDDNYYIRIIDHQANIITLTNNEHIIINLNDYSICNKEENSDSDISAENSSSNSESENKYWSNVDVIKIDKLLRRKQESI